MFPLGILFLHTRTNKSETCCRIRKSDSRYGIKMSTNDDEEHAKRLHLKIAFSRRDVSLVWRVKSGIWFTDDITSDKNLAACRRIRASCFRWKETILYYNGIVKVCWNCTVKLKKKLCCALENFKPKSLCRMREKWKIDFIIWIYCAL